MAPEERTQNRSSQMQTNTLHKIQQRLPLRTRTIDHNTNKQRRGNKNPKPSQMHQVPRHVDRLLIHTKQACQKLNNKSNDSSPHTEITWEFRKRHTPNHVETTILWCHTPHSPVRPPPILQITWRPSPEQFKTTTKHMPMTNFRRFQDHTHYTNANKNIHP